MSKARASTYVISITPFTADGRFDEDLVRRHLQRMGEGGVGVYVGGSGSGEGYTLDPDETRALLHIAAQTLKGVVPVRGMGTEPRYSRQMIDYARLVEEAGLDAMQIYSLDPGHGTAPTPEETERYLRDVLEEVRIPVVISTHQSVGYKQPVALLERLASQYSNLIGINCSHQDVGYLAELVDALGDRLEVHCGGPHQGLLTLALGGTGFLTSEANLAPKLCRSVIDGYLAGDVTAMMDSFGKVVRLSALLYGSGGIRMTKAVLGEYGLAGGIPRRPQLAPGDDDVRRVVAQVEELGVPGIEGLSKALVPA
jgi:4-hydroxy-tetrahydrodipicolinate synthase